ncbi:tail fiber domain-containing protein, partial [Patescibacteria group bacterium]
STFTNGIDVSDGCFSVNGTCITGGGGSSLWTDGGATSYLTSLTDNVAVGSASASYKLDVTGFINTDQYSGYKQAGNTILYASSTNTSALVGIDTGKDLLPSGTQSTAIGYQSLYVATSSDENTAVGYRSLYTNTSGYSNTAVGDNSLYLTTTGNRNVAIGKDSLYSNTTGSGNVSLGETALYNNTEGGNNIAVGRRALLSNTTGAYNVAVGRDAMLSNTDGGSNTAMGYAALNTSSSGDSGAAFGVYALYSNTTGSSNSAFGDSALYNNTEGASNTGMGRRALYGNVSGVWNTGVGREALSSNTTGNYNVGIGYQSAFYNKSASSTVNIGVEAGFGVSGQTYNQNGVFIGYRAGYGITTGDNNTLLGYRVGDNLTTGDSNILVGYDIDAPSATGNNQLSIGNIIFGTDIDGTGTTVSSGNIGIASTTPWALLSVNPDGTSGPSFVIGSSTQTDFIITEHGSVGIASTTTDFDLAVGNSGIYSGDTTFTNTSHSSFKENISDFEFPDNYLDMFAGVKVKNFKYKDDYAEANNLNIKMRVGLLADEFNPLLGKSSDTKTISGDDRMNVMHEAIRLLNEKVDLNIENFSELYVDSLGNVGIGTTTPNYKLHIIGGIAATSFINTSTRDAKTNIVHLDTNDEDDVLSKIKEMKVARYRYKDEWLGSDISNLNDNLSIGLIAEESPEEVLSADGKGVDIYKLSSFLLAGVKAQQSQIDGIKLDIESLKATLSSTTIKSLDLNNTTLVENIKSSLENLGLVIADNIATVKKLIVNDEICIGDTCLNESELKILLNNANINRVNQQENSSNENQSLGSNSNENETEQNQEGQENIENVEEVEDETTSESLEEVVEDQVATTTESVMIDEEVIFEENDVVEEGQNQEEQEINDIIENNEDETTSESLEEVVEETIIIENEDEEVLSEIEVQEQIIEVLVEEIIETTPIEISSEPISESEALTEEEQTEPVEVE